MHFNARPLALPEVALGVLPGTGGTQRLTRLIGKSAAIELMAEGRTMDFDEAQRLGIVNKVFDAPSATDFVGQVLAYAKRFVPPGKASLAVGLLKRAVQTGGELGLLDGLALERELQQRLFTSADAAEGLAAYVEKRPPQFTGR